MYENRQPPDLNETGLIINMDNFELFYIGSFIFLLIFLLFTLPIYLNLIAKFRDSKILIFLSFFFVPLISITYVTHNIYKDSNTKYLEETFTILAAMLLTLGYFYCRFKRFLKREELRL